MEKQRPVYLQLLPQEDWEATPASVRKLVEDMGQRIEKLEQQVGILLEVQQQLLEKINRTSKNSSSPPSSDPPNTPKTEKKQRSGRKRGGQKGHKGHGRSLYPLERCSSVVDHHPKTCSCCGEQLNGSDTNPYRHQIVEIPPITPIVIEHRLHQLVCQQCGSSNRATLPTDVNPTGYGARVVATVAVLSGLYRHSQRMVQTAMQDLFDIPMSLGTVNSLRLEASIAVKDIVDEAKQYVQKQPVVGADETSFHQANIDGCNPEERQAWLWVAVTPLVTFFEIVLSRCSKAARDLLGENFEGILTSDRHGAYNWVDLSRRQLCWAHLRRDFSKISERPGVCAPLGTELVKQQEKLFQLWHRVRDGTLNRPEFQANVQDIRSSIKALLQEGADYSIGTKEKTPLAQTVRTCRQLLKVEPAMWLFVTTEDVEPTNNAAERAIRPAVIWRRTSFGTQTKSGSTFVARMLTVVATLKSQRRDVLEFMTQAIIAARGAKPAPCLLPEVETCSDEHDLPTAA